MDAPLRLDVTGDPTGEVPGGPAHPSDAAFDDLARLAARRCGMPMAVIILTDRDRPLITSRVGIGSPQAERAASLGALAATGAGADAVVVADTLADRRVAGHPLVTGDPHIRSFALACLVATDGLVLGFLGVMDLAPRTLEHDQRHDLLALARQVVGQLELRRHAADLAAEIAATVVAKAALMDSQRVLDAILTQTEASIYAKDLQGRYLLATAPLVRMLGLTQDMVGRTDEDIFPAPTAAEYRRNDTEILNTGRTETFIEEWTDHDGSRHSYRSTKFPLRDDAGRIRGVAGLTIDVTELITARRDHLESEQRWRALVEHSPIAVAVISADDRLLYANPRAVSLLGADSTEWLIGRDASEFAPDPDSPGVAQVLRSVFDGGPPILSRRLRLRTRGGDLLTVEYSAASVTFDGRPAVQVELRDVTAQAIAERALRVSERRFHSVFEDSPVAMGLSDEQGRWVEVNAAFGELLGTTPPELIGATAHQFTDPADHCLIDSAEQGQIDSPDGVLRMEIRFRRPDGTTRDAWLNITPTLGPAGENWTLAIAQDITARKAAEDALRESEEDIAAVAAVARCAQSGEDPRPVVVATLHTLAQASSVSLIEALDTQTLVVTATVGTPADVVGVRIPLDVPSMSARVWQTGDRVFTPDVADEPVSSAVVRALDATVSALWQPLVIHGKVAALLVVTWQERIAGPDARSVRSVQLIADEAASTLRATRLMHELERSASTDPLTGSLNRRAWDAQLHILVQNAEQSGRPLAVAVIDLDFFKSFNDEHGHAAGDQVLSEFAAAARECLRRNDVFARWGGEEFIVALYDCAQDEAEQILDRIRVSVPAGRTCSIGFATWQAGEPISACIARADAALYAAKRGGRNRINAL